MREEGYSFLDLSEVSNSDELTVFGPESSYARTYHLVLDPNAMKADSSYKFRLAVAKTDAAISTDATVVIRTIPLPDTEGKCKVALPLASQSHS